jgi:hypothetical protein
VYPYRKKEIQYIKTVRSSGGGGGGGPILIVATSFQTYHQESEL